MNTGDTLGPYEVLSELGVAAIGSGGMSACGPAKKQTNLAHAGGAQCR